MDDLRKYSIEELINGYLDGELSERHKTELKRLMSHDTELADRVRWLVRQRKALQAIPREKAPKHMLDDIRSRIERNAILRECPQMGGVSKGTKHLVLMRLSSVAAVLLLFVGLSFVIWKVLSPPVETETGTPVAFSKLSRSTTPEVADLEKPIQPDLNVIESKSVREDAVESYSYQPEYSSLNGYLELEVEDIVYARTLISESIYNNSLLKETTFSRSNGELIYSVYGTPESISSLINDSRKVWDKSTNSTFEFTCSGNEPDCVLEGAEPQQITDILNTPSFDSKVSLVESYSALNRIYREMPGREFVNAIENVKQILPEMPVPVMTSSEPLISFGEAKKEESKPGAVNLKIVITEAN